MRREARAAGGGGRGADTELKTKTHTSMWGKISKKVLGRLASFFRIYYPFQDIFLF